MRKLFSFSLVLLLVCLLTLPAFASSESVYNEKTTFYHWFKDVPIVGDWIGYSLGAVCPVSEDKYHHASSYYAVKDHGYYDCICTYCGKHFDAYESDLKQSYNKQVEELPATGYTSAGSLIWQPTVDDVLIEKIYSNSNTDYTEFESFPMVFKSYYELNLNSSGNGFLCTISYPSGHPNIFSVGLVCTVTVPFSGMYGRILSPKYAVRCGSSKGDFVELSGYYEEGSFYYADRGRTIPFYFSYRDDGESPKFLTLKSSDGRLLSVYSGVMNIFFPVYEVIPDSTDIISGDTYSINTRPTTITGGNYGIVGDGGTINTVTNNKPVINETTNIYYNPATGQSYPIENWSYNYENRSYTVTLNTGDTVNVEYGDENITITENNIVEGDTIVNNYTIYYIVDGSGGGESHVHEWHQTGAKQGNCVTPAQRTYTCADCGEQYTETDPVLGHSWRIIQTVSTKYNEDGSLLQEGYTIYECERCGEQYRATNDTGPPSSGSDSSGGGTGGSGDDGESIWGKIGNFLGAILEGLLGMIGTVIGKILDGLTALCGMLMEKLTAVVETVLTIFEEVPKLFGGFLDFLSAMFPFLPDEIMLLLTFGIAAVVFVGIIKAIRR